MLAKASQLARQIVVSRYADTNPSIPRNERINSHAQHGHKWEKSPSIQPDLTRTFSAKVAQ
jgi:hypothetical protein